MELCGRLGPRGSSWGSFGGWASFKSSEPWILLRGRVADFGRGVQTKKLDEDLLAEEISCFAVTYCKREQAQSRTELRVQRAPRARRAAPPTACLLQVEA